MQLRAVVSPTRPSNEGIQTNKAPSTMHRLTTNHPATSLYLPNRPNDTIVCTMPNCSGTYFVHFK